MCLKLFLFLFVFVSCEEGRRVKRKTRFLSFNTVNDDIRIELEFTIPFITIPAKGAMDSAMGLWSPDQPININPGSLAIGGAVVLMSTVIFPILLKSFTHHYPQQKYSRLLDKAEFSTDTVLDFASNIVDSKNFYGCALRIACWTGQSATKTDPIRMWKHVTSSNLFPSMINSTAIEDAVLSGRNGRECSSYTPCPLNNDHLPYLLDHFINLAHSEQVQMDSWKTTKLTK